MNPMFRRLLAGCVLALVLPACGKSPKDFRFTVHPAAGTVLHKGKPVSRAFVRFHPVDPATVAIPEGKEGLPVVLTTETDEEGRFAMSTYLADDGVPAGEYTVTVTAAPTESDIEHSDAGFGWKPRRAPAFEKVYQDPTTTPLKVTVEPGENHFELKLN